MSRRSWRWLRRSHLPLAVVTTAVVVGAFGSASAASFGGLRAGTIFTSSAAVTNAAPAVLACDNFALAAATGAALDNRPGQVPSNCANAVWTVHSGTWTIATGQLQVRTNDSSATVAAGGVDVSAQTTVLNANAGRTRAAGVAINHSGASQVFLAGVVVSGNLAQLRLVSGTTVTTLATAAATVGAASVVRLTRQGTAITLRVDGSVVLTFTLTPAQVATLTGTRTGLYWSRGNSLRFTDFVATQAAP
jgi:hypothetical protein